VSACGRAEQALLLGFLTSFVILLAKRPIRKEAIFGREPSKLIAHGYQSSA